MGFLTSATKTQTDRSRNDHGVLQEQDGTDLARNRKKLWAFVNTVMNIRVHKIQGDCFRSREIISF
jgi:hypothetical protein